jgi:hypothetical protein
MMNHGARRVRAARATGAEIVQSLIAQLAGNQILQAVPAKFDGNRIVSALMTQFAMKEKTS